MYFIELQQASLNSVKKKKHYFMEISELRKKNIT